MRILLTFCPLSNTDYLIASCNPFHHFCRIDILACKTNFAILSTYVRHDRYPLRLNVYWHCSPSLEQEHIHTHSHKLTHTHVYYILQMQAQTLFCIKPTFFKLFNLNYFIFLFQLVCCHKLQLKHLIYFVFDLCFVGIVKRYDSTIRHFRFK